MSGPANAASLLSNPQYLVAGDGPGLIERIFKNIPRASQVKEDPFGEWVVNNNLYCCCDGYSPAGHW